MPAEDLEITGYFELDEDNQEDWINLSFVAGENGSLDGTLNFRVLKAYPLNSDEQVYKVIIPTPIANAGYAFDKWDKIIDLNATLTEDTTFVALFKDIIPPAIENLKVVRDITNDDEIKVFGKIYDENIKNYNLRIVDQDKKLVSPWKGITVPENRDGELGVFDISDLDEGNYFVRVWANDTYGNSTGHNPHIYVPFTIDRTAPTITVKPAPDSIGLIDEAIFSKVSFKLYDKYKIDYVELNGVKKDLTNNQWSDLNDVRPGIYGAVEGENELVLYDVAGNKTSYKFILDIKAPTVSVKPAPDSIGLIDEAIFSKVSFKLYDKYKIDYVELNGVKKDLTNNQWSDLNDVRPGIYGAVEGENELVLYDVAGNKTSYKFILDIKAPTVSDITIDPYINNNTGGSKVTVYFKLTDSAGIDLSKTYVMFADGPNTDKAKKESGKLNPILISDNNYKVEFNSREFVAANYVGNYNLQFTMVDNLGNRTSTKPAKFRPILVDNSGPEASLTSPISGTTVNGTVRFNFEVTDHTDVASGYMKLREMDKTFNLTRGIDNNWYVDIDTKLLTGGMHTIDVRFVDVFGNPRASKNKGTFNVDNKGPVINHVYYKNDWEEKAWSTGTTNNKRTKTMTVRFMVTDNVEVDYVRVFWTNEYNINQGFTKLKNALLNNPELAGTELVTKAANGYYYSTAPAAIEGTYKMGIVAVDVNGNVTAWPGYDMHFMIEEEVVDTNGPNISSVQYKNDWEEKAWYPGTSDSKRTNTMTVKFKVDDPSGVEFVKVIWTNKYNMTQGHTKLREAMRNNPNLEGLELIEKNADGRYHSTAPTGIKGVYKMGIIAVDTLGNIRTWATPDMHFKDESSYRVEHYFQNILDDEYTLDESKTQILYEIPGTQTNVVAMNLEGFTALDVEQVIVSSDNDSVVKVYSNRKVNRLTYLIQETVVETKEETIVEELLNEEVEFEAEVSE